MAGIDHSERVAIALAVSVRYGGEADPDCDAFRARLLDEEEHEHWRSVGLALRLAYSLTAATPGVLRQRRSQPASQLTLHAPEGRRGDVRRGGRAPARGAGRALDLPIGTGSLPMRRSA